MAPDFFAVHPIAVHEPEEDILLLDLSFLSQTPEAIMHVPSYAAWAEEQEPRFAYEYLARCMKLLSWQRPGKRWLLKSPHHLEQLDALAQVFDTLTLVHTRRDPRETSASFCSMVAHGCHRYTLVSWPRRPQIQTSPKPPPTNCEGPATIAAMAQPTWRNCSRCKGAIPCASTYLVCSVSTCNRVRAGLVFCSMECWDAHLPIARHREAFAEERRAPATPNAPALPPRQDKAKSTGRRLIAPVSQRDPSLPKDPLVITKALKAYILAAGGLRTSDAVVALLSEKLRDSCDRAISRAKDAERKTVLDRDFLPK